MGGAQRHPDMFLSFAEAPRVDTSGDVKFAQDLAVAKFTLPNDSARSSIRRPWRTLKKQLRAASAEHAVRQHWARCNNGFLF